MCFRPQRWLRELKEQSESYDLMSYSNIINLFKKNLLNGYCTNEKDCVYFQHLLPALSILLDDLQSYLQPYLSMRAAE